MAYVVRKHCSNCNGDNKHFTSGSGQLENDYCDDCMCDIKAIKKKQYFDNLASETLEQRVAKLEKIVHELINTPSPRYSLYDRF
jgi:hypothetical protein